jgi:hypothetical protein
VAPEALEIDMTVPSAKKSFRGRPRVDATPVNVLLPPDQLAALDAWIASSKERHESRPEAIRSILLDYLRRRNFYGSGKSAVARKQKWRGNAETRAESASFAEKAAGKQIDRRLAGTGQPADVKAERKKRLTKIPRELRTKPKEGQR